MDVILQSEQLTLVPLSMAQLALCHTDLLHLEEMLGCAISRSALTDVVRRAIAMKLDKMSRAEPARHAWYTYWLLVIRADGFGAGLAGFKGFPDALGEAEIGYGIDAAYQGRGYMTDGARLLIAWGFEKPACRAVVARGVKRWNVASQRVLAKAGMTIYQEYEESSNWRISRSELAGAPKL